MRSLSRSVIAVTTIAAALVVAGCLPAALRPTPTPGPTAAPTPTPTPVPTPTPGPPTPTPAPTFALHTVKRGDSLTSLATQYRTTGRSIAYWNRDIYPTLDPESASYNPDRLQIGWVLRILPGQEYQAPMDAGESPDVTPSPGDSGSPSPPAPSPAG